MNILMIALHYHDYTANIADELRRLGHEVTVHDIMPRDLPTKAVRVLAPRLWQERLDRHHHAILKGERGKMYDMVLFIQVHQMSQENLARFREAFGEARFVLYNWDSIANHDYRAHLHAFDDVYTFDPEDARRYGLKYLPLFCSRAFQGLRRRAADPRTVYFVGNIVNPRRYEALDAFRSYCASHDIPLQTHAACTPPSLLKLLRGGIRPRGLKFGSISQVDFLDMVETSAATFDFANHAQTGYTMRVFENLCAGKKIITNNRRIGDEPFYSPDRIHVFDELDLGGIDAFLSHPLEHPEQNFPEFHIQAFARHLVEGEGHPLPDSAGKAVAHA